MSARQLTDTVWLVGSGTDPEALTDPHDCHVYLIDGGSQAALVDCGTGLAGDRLLANIEQTGLLPKLTTILVTHYHADHAGGAARLWEATGAEVRAAPETVHALATGDEERTQIAAARRAGVYPTDYRGRALPHAQPLDPDGTLSLGDISITAHDAPGHCDGHVCYLARQGTQRALFSGDAVFAHGRISLQPIPDCRPHVLAETCRALCDLAPHQLLPGHGEQVLVDGSRHLRRARGYFDRLTVPPNLGS